MNFLEKRNIDTLWEVIADEDIYTFLTKEAQHSVHKIFTENIKGFFDTEKNETKDVIEMNKKYILLILNYIKTRYPEKIPNKIKIYEEPVTKELITYEEIQTDKKTQFEKEWLRIQDEFTKTMSIPVPNAPKFEDETVDEPIKEMDKMIREIAMKRNYEVDIINQSNENNKNVNVDQWLKPKETSIKNDKLVPKISKEKNVSWGENSNFIELEEKEYETNILKKLKLIKNESLSKSPSSIEDRLTELEVSLQKYNSKIDRLMNLLENKMN
jgi:hypothetical protein